MITSVTLKKNTSFRSVMNQGAKWITPGFIVFVAPQNVANERNGNDESLLWGVVASKKVGNAVIRNRAKRRLREVIRLHDCNALAGQCLILIARTGALSFPFEKLQNDLRWALKRLNVSHKTPVS